VAIFHEAFGLPRRTSPTAAIDDGLARLRLDEVHRANMSKLGADGQPVLRDDGKVLKSERYSPPDVAAVVARAQSSGMRGR